MKKNILLVEDEEKLRIILKEYFLKEEFSIFEASDGQEALDIFQQEEINLIILDIMLPKMDGWSVCRRIRKISDVPVIILTARVDDDDKLLGYELGADEYVTKPYSPKVLVARVKALLRRAEGSVGKEEGHFILSGINVDTLGRRVFIDEEEVTLTHKEFELLLYLMENKNVVLSREILLNQVWGYDYFGDDRTVDTHIKKLRRKLGEKAVHIRTIIRSGYKFEE